MSVGQTEFRTAILDARVPVPDGLINPDGAPATKRFDVYRNNVAVSLTDALETAFPVINKLLGEANFKALAGMYLRRFPPNSPLLMFYGKEMPEFLAGIEQLRHLPYLGDIARLELSLREAYHAADAKALELSTLQNIDPERLAASTFNLAPSVRLIRSHYPVHGIWRMNTVEGAAPPEAKGENAMISRPGFDPIVTLLLPGAGLLLDRLMSGATFGAAVEEATEKAPEFNLSETLVQLFSAAAITSITEPET